MRSHSSIIIILAGILSLACCLFPLPALAAVSIQLSNISYTNCPAEYAEGNVGSGSNMAATCYLVQGKAKNPSGKTVYDADVFGRIYDANNNTVMPNRTRVGTIAEVPPGVSDFEIRISVPANQPTPLQLKQFKASGFSSKVRPYYYQDEDDFANFNHD